MPKHKPHEGKTERFTKLPVSIWEDAASIPPVAFKVLIYLLWRSGSSGKAYPKQGTIAADLGISRPTVCIALSWLEKHKYIERKRRHRSFEYQPTLPCKETLQEQPPVPTNDTLDLFNLGDPPCKETLHRHVKNSNTVEELDTTGTRTPYSPSSINKGAEEGESGKWVKYYCECLLKYAGLEKRFRGSKAVAIAYDQLEKDGYGRKHFKRVARLAAKDSWWNSQGDGEFRGVPISLLRAKTFPVLYQRWEAKYQKAKDEDDEEGDE